MTGVRLTEAEVDELRRALRRWLPFSYEGGVGYLTNAVEAILTARLAGVEALVKDWDMLIASTCGGCDSCDGNRHHTLVWVAAQLRAALTDPAPDRASVAGGGDRG